MIQLIKELLKQTPIILLLLFIILCIVFFMAYLLTLIDDLIEYLKKWSDSNNNKQT